jgi:recombination protein RecR
MKHPAPIRNLIEALLILPGIGRRTAERFAYSLLQKDPVEINQLVKTLAALPEVKSCQRCYQFSENTLCTICADSNRDGSTLCLVEHGRFILPLEQTGHYRGVYFCLGGLLDPLNSVKPLTIRLDKLKTRLKGDGVKEILLAFDVDPAGDATCLYIKKMVAEENLPIRLTRLARGLSTGAQLEYADDITLTNALDNRREF